MDRAAAAARTLHSAVAATAASTDCRRSVQTGGGSQTGQHQHPITHSPPLPAGLIPLTYGYSSSALASIASGGAMALQHISSARAQAPRWIPLRHPLISCCFLKRVIMERMPGQQRRESRPAHASARASHIDL